MTFNPFEQHEDFERKKEEDPLKLLKKGVGVAASIAGGSSLINRLLPLLSSHIPEKIAKKGIEKVNPQLGNFVESATNFGYDFYQVRDFLRAKAAEEQKTQEEKKDIKSPSKGNIIQQYSPQLHEFLTEEIQKGRSPLEAGALASIQDSFKPIIKKLVQDHQSPFSSILETVYGSTQQPSVARSQTQPSQPTGGQGKAALAQILQELTQALQKRGNG